MDGGAVAFLRALLPPPQRHLWQGRFKSPAVAVEDYFLSCARYIERNPVEAGLVTEPWLYRWSSCRSYVLGTADPLLS